MKITGRITALLLSIILLFTTAGAEGTVVPLDGSDQLLNALPLDDYTVCGPRPDPECYTELTYKDASIEVTCWHEWIDDGHVNAAHIKIADASQLRTALWENSLKRNHYVWHIADVNNAVVACGGEFLANKDNKNTYTIRMSNELRTRYGYTKRDGLIIDDKGDFHILHYFSKEGLQELTDSGIKVVNLFNFGPALVIDGEIPPELGKKKPLYPVGYTTALQPRTAIGQIGPLEYLMVVVDGRLKKCDTEDGTKKSSKGLNVATLGQYMLDHGCVQAYTLDGGGSAAMYFNNGIAKDGIFSVPAEKRGVTDIVYFATLVGN